MWGRRKRSAIARFGCMGEKKAKRFEPFGIGLLGAFVTVLGVGCGSGSTATTGTERAAASTTTTSLAPTTLPPTTTTTRPPPPVIQVVGTDYVYSGVSETAPAGTKIEFINESPGEFHELAVLRVDPADRRTLDDFATLSFADLNDVGQLIGVALARPGEGTYRTVEGQTRLNLPGRYIIFCTVPVGSDPAEIENQVEFGPPKQIEGVPSHYQVGMLNEIIVPDAA